MKKKSNPINYILFVVFALIQLAGILYEANLIDAINTNNNYVQWLMSLMMLHFMAIAISWSLLSPFGGKKK